MAEGGSDGRGRPPLEREALLEELRRLAHELGHPPTTSDMRDQGEHSHAPYYPRFGSWNDALRAAGLNPANLPARDGPVINDEELLEELRSFDSTPTTNDMAERGAYAPETYIDRFGSWNDALRAAGHEPTRNDQLTEVELLEDLRDLADELGRPPRTTDMRDRGPHAHGRYIDRFGSWKVALEAAGLEAVDGRQQAYGKGELLTELKRLADELGRSPKTQDMVEHGAYSPTPYYTQFGSWGEALKAAGVSDR